MPARAYSLFVALALTAIVIVIGAVLIPQTLDLIEMAKSLNDKLLADDPEATVISIRLHYITMLSLAGGAIAMAFVATRHWLIVIRGVPVEARKGRDKLTA